MRETLTFLAAGILVVLALALAVPPFIDWSAYGAALGSRLGQALGADVRLGGTVSVRLLPSPHFQTGALRVTRPGLDLQADGASLELALTPLLRGTLSIASARLERPRIAIDTNASFGTFALPADLGIERLALRDALVSLHTPDGSRQIDHVDVIASAESVTGPFKAEGFVRAENRILPFRAATGGINGGRLPLKIDVDPLAGLPRMEASGMLILGEKPRVEGILTLSGEIEGVGRGGGAALPWRAKFGGQASPNGAKADSVELRAGDDRAQAAATGTGAIDDRGMTLSFTSERPDVDRVLAAFDPMRIANALASASAGRTFSVEWKADAAVFGGEVISDARIFLSRPQGDTRGQTRADISLAVTRGGQVSFKGNADGLARLSGDLAVRTDDAPGFSRWLGALAPNGSIAEVPFRRAELAGHLDIGGEQTELRDLRATLDRSTFAGRIAFTAKTAKTSAKVDADLTASALDLDALPDLSNLARQASGVDLAVALDARAIRVARVGRAALEAGHISLAVTRKGDVLALDRLSLDNVGGATLRASGKVTASDAHLAATLDAKQLGDLATLTRRIVPGLLSDTFASRAPSLAPATLDLAFDASVARGGALVPTRVSVSGNAADTQVRATLAPHADDASFVDGTVALDAPEAAPLLRQLGVPVIPLRGQGGAKIEARISGQGGAPRMLTATAAIAGSNATFDGTTDPNADALNAVGLLKTNARDLGPLLRIVAAPVDTFGGWPVDASAQIELRGRDFAAKKIAGRIGSANVTGSLARDGNAPVTGSLHLDRLDVASLASILLGPPQSQKADRLWSTLAFAPQPNDPPGANIDLSADKVIFAGGVEGAKATTKVAFRAGAIEATAGRMDLAGGILEGAAALRREDKTASFVATLQAERVALELPWLSARLSGRVELAGAGVSPAALVGSLGGKGVLRVADAELARADIEAPAQIAKAVDAEEIALDPRAIRAALMRAFDAGPQQLPAFEQPLMMAAGKASIAPFDLAVGTARVAIAAQYDLASDRVELRETVNPLPPEDWAGPPPSVMLALTGPSNAPVRSVDATDLVGTLAAHGLVREQARIATIEADQRERTFFNRRLKVDRVLEAQRKAEEARAEAARQEALKQEAARQDVIRKEAARQDALRQERERRETQRAREFETPAGTAPLDVRPPAASRPSGASGLIAPDPGAAGRY